MSQRTLGGTVYNTLPMPISAISESPPIISIPSSPIYNAFHEVLHLPQVPHSSHQIKIWPSYLDDLRSTNQPRFPHLHDVCFSAFLFFSELSILVWLNFYNDPYFQIIATLVFGFLLGPIGVDDEVKLILVSENAR